MGMWVPHFSLWVTFTSPPAGSAASLPVFPGCRHARSLPHLLLERQHAPSSHPHWEPSEPWAACTLPSEQPACQSLSIAPVRVPSQSLCSANTKRCFMSSQQAGGREISRTGVGNGHTLPSETLISKLTLEVVTVSHNIFIFVLCPLVVSPASVFQPFPLGCGVLTAYCVGGWSTYSSAPVPRGRDDPGGTLLASLLLLPGPGVGGVAPELGRKWGAHSAQPLALLLFISTRLQMGNVLVCSLGCRVSKFHSV